MHACNTNIYISSMMGGTISRVGDCRANFQARLRPLLLEGLAGVRTWRRLPAQTKEETPSKKGLLMHPPKNAVAMATVIGNTYGIKVAAKRPNLRLRSKKRPIKKRLDNDDEDEDDDEGRNIAFPGSPSFRVFFQDAALNQIGENHDAVVDEETLISTPQKKVKRERKKLRENIKTVISGKRREVGIAVKKVLLNVKALSH